MLPDDWLRPFEGRYSRQVPMARRTTWRIGGPAELLLDPGNVEELAAMVRALWRSGVDYRVLGGGSNLLVHDRGVRGVVLSLARMRRVRIDGCHVDAEAGADLHRVVRCAERAGLTGAEALAGIPGRIGGAVFGNSGGRYGDIGRLVASIDLLEPDGTLVRLRPRPGFFRYRQTDVGARIIVRATLRLEDDLPEAVSERTRSIRLERRGTQPGWIGNSGCVFKNPVGGSAGFLIDSAECKGMREGGLHVSRIHANFIENRGGGTSEGVHRLVDRVRERVRRVHGADLSMEVRQWR